MLTATQTAKLHAVSALENDREKRFDPHSAAGARKNFPLRRLHSHSLAPMHAVNSVATRRSVPPTN